MIPKVGLLLGIFICAAALYSGGASAGQTTLRVDPEAQSVGQDEEFELRIILNATVDTSAAQTDIEFDAELLQIEDVVVGEDFQGASFIVGVAPQTKAEAIESPNVTGKLENVAAFFLPGVGSVPPGDAEAFVLMVKSRDHGGVSEIKLSAMEVNDAQGTGIPDVANEDGEVTVAGPTISPTPVGQTPTPTPEPTATPRPTPTPTPPPPLDGRMWVQPATLAIKPGVEFFIDIMQSQSRDARGAQTSIRFDPALLQIVSVVTGPAYHEGREQALLIMGETLPDGTQVTGRAAIDAANSTGLLKNVAAAWIPPRFIPAGEAIFLTVVMKSTSASGMSPIGLEAVEMIDTAGDKPVGVVVTNGQIEVSVDAPEFVPPRELAGAANRARRAPRNLPRSGAGPLGVGDEFPLWIAGLLGGAIAAAGVYTIIVIRKPR